ncbi:hypothetical protein [Streptomyces sp. NPDC008137]|uniref:hypothetical protein n=1 Tax=Streptomyces sp. NPDC008137 TaxID=3364813 RepID=UPI0036EA0BA8
MKGQAQLGDFLRTRRSQLRPADVGVLTYGEHRRVPGLRGGATDIATDGGYAGSGRH